MLAEAASYLCCPYCGQQLELIAASLQCAQRHSFDIARQGYASLLRGDTRTGTADTAAMVEAREAFLRAGHFLPIAEAVSDLLERLVRDPSAGCVVELGAGTGYYIAYVLDRLSTTVGLALDISKAALRRASRAHPRLAAVAGDVWGRLPVRTGVAVAVMNVFAPRNATEIARILARDGVLAVVTPTAAHLKELVGPLGLLNVDERKDERLDAAFAGAFERLERATVVRGLHLSRDDVAAVAGMGPGAWHAEPGTLSARVRRLPPTSDVTLSVNVDVFRKAPAGSGGRVAPS